MKKWRSEFFGIFVLILITALSVLAQTPAERHERIRADVGARDFKKALDEVRSLRAADPGLFHANNFDYLQARLAQLNGDSGEAAAAYQSVLARKSVLSQYALWHLAQFARSIGDLTLERERLRQLTASFP